MLGQPCAKWQVSSDNSSAGCVVVSSGITLQATHAEGLAHGNLHAGSFVMTGGGVLKLCGLGEPRWLAALTENGSAPGG